MESRGCPGTGPAKPIRGQPVPTFGALAIGNRTGVSGAPGHRKDEGDSQLGERLLFAAYALVIVLGLALFLVAGITHR